ncbi:hypothetical protein PHYPSEUDO_011456 [Phytophthora pseudosyringae]|uniref:RxLR effector protein n=1 Tax=Phytophthora pseudosyringae TaxID=221518 RepID=A0A8T1WA88_9STRA|nr:hypothetical protein PHYPSEUDO_011456 [Phytophthora pseudosyringae]
MRLLHLVVTIAVGLAAVSNGITTTANEIIETTTAKSNSIHDAALDPHVATRELSGDDAQLEERRGGGGGGGGHGGGGGGHGGGGGGGHGVSGGGGHVTTATGGGGGDGTTGGGHATTTTGGGGDTTYGGGRVYGTHTSIGLMNTNSVSDRKTKKKCNRFTNWFKRLFNKNVKKCPKKDEEEVTRRLRA